MCTDSEGRLNAALVRRDGRAMGYVRAAPPPALPARLRRSCTSKYPITPMSSSITRMIARIGSIESPEPPEADESDPAAVPFPAPDAPATTELAAAESLGATEAAATAVGVAVAPAVGVAVGVGVGARVGAWVGA